GSQTCDQRAKYRFLKEARRVSAANPRTVVAGLGHRREKRWSEPPSPTAGLPAVPETFGRALGGVRRPAPNSFSEKALSASEVPLAPTRANTPRKRPNNTACARSLSLLYHACVIWPDLFSVHRE